MGIAQRRIVKDYQESIFPGWKKQFDEVCGCEIPMEVKWETMQKDEYNRDLYFKYYEAVYFRPLMSVFTDLCSDTLGKDAVKAGVKKIIIDGSEGIGPKYSTFTDGVFTLKHKFEKDRAEGWKKTIGAKL